jgi:hypothetical protein
VTSAASHPCSLAQLHALLDEVDAMARAEVKPEATS